jgi:hypothetical protein
LKKPSLYVLIFLKFNISFFFEKISKERQKISFLDPISIRDLKRVTFLDKVKVTTFLSG